MPRDYEQTAAVLVAEAEKAIVAAVEPLLKRIEALEARPAPERGEKGADGPPGRDGLSVKTMLVDRDGHLRCVMADGTDHDLGEVVGRDGRDGEKGETGEQGESIKGEKGDKGDPGEAIKGDPGPQGPPGERGADAYHGRALGLYNPEEQYKALDVVSLNGSEWRAKVDNPGSLPGDDWMLSAQRGKRGEEGKPGPQGRDGKPGKDAAEIIQMTLDSTTMKLIVVFSDGCTQEADFEPFARQIQEALSGSL